MRYFAEALERRRLLAGSVGLIVDSPPANFGLGPDTTITGTNGPDVIRFNSAGSFVQVTINGTSTVYFDDDIGHVTLRGMGGDDDIYIDGTGTRIVTAEGGSGLDNFFVAELTHNLNKITVGVECFVEADGGILTMYDDASTANMNYTWQDSFFYSDLSDGVFYLDMYAVYFWLSQGNNNVQASSSSSAYHTIYAGDGIDSLELGAIGLTLEPILCNMSFEGGPGLDTFYIYDQLSATGNWTIHSNSILHNNKVMQYSGVEILDMHAGTAANYITVENFSSQALVIDAGMNDDDIEIQNIGTGTQNILLYGNQGSDQFTVDALPASCSLNVHGDGDNDELFIGYYLGDIDLLQGPIDFIGGAGNNTIYLVNNSVTIASAYYFTPGAVSALTGSFGGIEFANASNLYFYGSDGASEYYIDGSTADTSTTIFTGPGDDVIRFGYFAADCTAIQGPVRCDGDDDADTVEVYDTTPSDNRSYAFGEIGLNCPAFAALTFDHIEFATLNTGSGDNNINIANTSILTLLYVNAGDGADLLRLNGSVTEVELNGQGGLDTIEINLVGTTPGFAAITESDQLQRLVVGANSLLSLRPDVTLSTYLSTTIAGTIDFGYRASFIAKESTTSMPLSTARALVNKGYQNGGWLGNGQAFRSVYAQAVPGNGIGYARASDLNASNYHGVSVAPDDVIFTQTLYGDATLDYMVNFNDLLKLAQSYGAASGKWWFNGDFDYNQNVNFNDLLRMAQSYGHSAMDDQSRHRCIAWKLIID